MTTTVSVSCNGNYVAEVKVDDDEVVNVGPGSNVKRDFHISNGSTKTFVVTERDATQEEIDALTKTT